MKTISVQRTTIDLVTGDIVEEATVPLEVQPPPAHACQVCGRVPNHDPGQPHDAQQLYYQLAFYAEHGQWPTWRDAMAHCAEPVRAAWERSLRERGVWPVGEE